MTKGKGQEINPANKPKVEEFLHTSRNSSEPGYPTTVPITIGFH